MPLTTTTGPTTKWEHPNATGRRLEAEAMQRNARERNAAAREAAPKTKNELLRALKKYASAHPIIGSEQNVIEKMKAKIAALTAEAERKADEARRFAEAEAVERSKFSAMRERNLTAAGEQLLNPRGTSAALLNEHLCNAGMNGSMQWKDSLAFARSLVDAGLFGELAGWLGTELGRPNPNWL